MSAGVRSFTFPSATTLAEIDRTTPGPGDRLSVQAVDRFSDRSPYTDSYSFTISQRLPWQSLLEVAYVGNQSNDLLNSGGPGNNLNVIPYGAFFSRPGDPNSFNVDEFRPLKGFQDLRIATHNTYSNYNSMQISWLRTKGRYNINMNYTWGKAMGIVGNYDDLNLNNNYGPQPNDRRQLFNAAYSIELGNFVKRNKLGGGLLNGWQFSGITQFQSGLNLTANSGGNYNLDTGGAQLPNGYNISDRTINGTTAIALRPRLTCDPGSGLSGLQKVNGACFALPTGPGTNGPTVMPALYGPAFMNWDLGLFKNFQMGEQRKLQFRFNAYNFLNHPLWSFVSTGTNLRLRFNAQGQMVNPTFGNLTEKQGRRILQFALKYYF